MNQVDIKSKKESLVITCLLFLVFFVVLFFLKFDSQILIPQLEGGGGGGNIAVNFGDSEFGSGKNMESIATTKSKIATALSKEIVAEALLTNRSDTDVPAILETKKTDIKPTKTVEKPIVLEKPKVSKSTNDALANILKSNSNSGDGDDNVGGNKGQTTGNTKNNGYSGGGNGNGSGTGNGSGSGLGTGTGYGSGMGNGRGNGAGNYLLSGRKALTKPNPKYDCNEQGIVVVQIKVNNAGQVIEATPGLKGTTNSASCLTSQAKIAAMNTKFDANADAPEKQVGKIIYNFKLSN